MKKKRKTSSFPTLIKMYSEMKNYLFLSISLSLFFSFPYFFLIFIKEKSLVITTSFPSRSLFAHCRARGVALGSMKTVVVFSFK